MESANQPSNFSLRDRLFEQCEAMVVHSLALGLEVPAAVVQTIAASKEDDPAEDSKQAATSLTRLAVAHQQMVKIVAPATPQAILLLTREAAKGGVLRWFGAVPLVRQLMLLSGVFLVLMVGLASTEPVTVKPGTMEFSTAKPTDVNSSIGGSSEDDSKPELHIQWSMYESSGSELLLKLTFLMSTAGLGACFASLFRVNRFVVNRTYDPAYATSYWIRLLTGVIAGVVLCELIPTDQTKGPMIHIPTLALLGGFSGNTVYRILERLVASVESVVGGDMREAADAQVRVATSQAMQKTAEHRAALTAKLASLNQQLNTTDGVDTAKQQLEALLNELGQPEIMPPALPDDPA